jgi:hypothetical protein
MTRLSRRGSEAMDDLEKVVGDLVFKALVFHLLSMLKISYKYDAAEADGIKPPGALRDDAILLNSS